MIRLKFDDGSERIFDTALLTVGRSQSCMLSIDHPMVSRRHFLLEFIDGGWFIIDEGSSAGTVLEGQKLGIKKALPISSGQKIILDDFSITFFWDGLKPKEEHTMVMARKLMEGYFIATDATIKNAPSLFENNETDTVPKQQPNSKKERKFSQISQSMAIILDGIFLVLFLVTIGAMSFWLINR